MAQELKRLNGFGNFDKFGGYYDAEDVDAILAEKDAFIKTLGEGQAGLAREIEQLKQKLEDAKASHCAEMVDTREAVAELKDPYFTTCVICNKPWGAGELHAMHRVSFHGRLVTNLFVCCDCNAKIRRGEI